MNNKIKYSVNMPVFNTSDFLSESIQSIINQTYKNWELIIINDGSTDNSLEICKHYAEKDSRIKIITQENKGLLQTRIKGRQLSKGEYLIFVDSDDLLDKKALEEINKTINSTNSDLILFLYQRIENDGSYNNISSYNVDKNNKVNIFESLLKTSQFNNLCLKAVKKELINKDEIKYAKLGHINKGEDLLQSVPLIYNAKNIVILNKPLYYYRDNEDSITSNLSLKTIEDTLKVYEVIIKYLKDNEIEEELINNFHTRVTRNITKDYLIYSSQKNVAKQDKLELIKAINNYDIRNIRNKTNYIYKLIKKEKINTLNIFVFMYKSLQKIKRIFC